MASLGKGLRAKGQNYEVYERKRVPGRRNCMTKAMLRSLNIVNIVFGLIGHH